MRNCFKMFGTHKVLCAIALALVMGFSMTACDDGGGDNTDYGDGTDVTTVAQLSGFLSKTATNTIANPIDVTINMDIETHWEEIVNALSGAERYVALDLSGSTGTTMIGLSGQWTGCNWIVSVTLPDTLTSIGYFAFYRCYNLPSIIIPSGVTSIGEGAFSFGGLHTSITLPSSVISIGDSAFSSTYLTSITIPDGVTSIERWAFSNTHLTSITIPDGVTSIGNSAFNNCRSLASVTFEGTITSENFSSTSPFPGDLRDKYLAGGIGTYTTTRTAYDNDIVVWTKQ